MRLGRVKRRAGHWGLVASTALIPVVSAAAQDASARAWRDLTTADVDAAYEIIARNHPGASPAAGDSAFRQALERGRAEARARSREVRSYEGWLATLRAFAVSFADPHISLGTRLSSGSVRWPGFVVARRGDSTVVASSDSTFNDVPRPDAVLVACDGASIDEFSRTRIGVFRGTWDVASQRVRNTPFLLVDDGNPFLTLPSSCLVREAGRNRTVQLRWRPIASGALQERLRDASPIGNAGFEVKPVDNGWWIGIQSLSGRVQAVLDSVAAHAAAIRTAPWVVVDVRGNSGGNSEYGRRLSVLLTGDARTAAAMRAAERDAGATSGLCGVSWRSSADVEATIEGYIRDMGPRLGESAIASWRRDVDSIRVARQQGRDLAPEPRRCTAAPATDAAALPPSLMKGRLILLTDHACFSSCLLLTGLFRAVGALHVGEGTDFSTRYMEVRGFPLPSGLGSFSTLQKAAFGMPARLGPFEPDVPFAGRMDDTRAIQTWISGLVMRGSSRGG